MTDLERLRSLNPGLSLREVGDPAFAAYGRVIPGLDVSNIVDHLVRTAPVGDAPAYLRSLPALEDLPGPALPAPFAGSAPVAGGTRPGPLPHTTWKQWFQSTVFGGLPAQMGWVVGRNTKLNALEYHKSSEVLVAASDLILLLGRLDDIEGHARYPADKVEGFLVRQGQTVETWSTTLHFAPVQTSPDGFRAVIVLPAGTNAPLEAVDPGQPGEPGLLWAVNKWLIACPGSGPAGKGAKVGIDRNIEVRL